MVRVIVQVKPQKTLGNIGLVHWYGYLPLRAPPLSQALWILSTLNPQPSTSPNLVLPYDLLHPRCTHVAPFVAPKTAISVNLYAVCSTVAPCRHPGDGWPGFPVLNCLSSVVHLTKEADERGSTLSYLSRRSQTKADQPTRDP